MIAKTPSPPYYAVIFTSLRTDGDHGYANMARRMIDLACSQDGFLGVESARETIGITVSYWRDPEAIAAWRENAEHQLARELGRSTWYKLFRTRIALVEKEYGFSHP